MLDFNSTVLFSHSTKLYPGCSGGGGGGGGWLVLKTAVLPVYCLLFGDF